MTEVEAKVRDRELIVRRRKQILDAARVLFHKNGYHRTSVRDIGELAGITQGTLYNYVRRKEDILYLICDDLVSKIRRAIGDALSKHEEPKGQLRSAVRGLVEIMDKYQDDVLLMYHESHSLPAPLLKNVLSCVHEYIEDFTEICEVCKKTEGYRILNAQLAANILTFLPTIIALRRWDLKNCGDRSHQVEEIVAFAMRGIGASD